MRAIVEEVLTELKLAPGKGAAPEPPASARAPAPAAPAPRPAFASGGETAAKIHDYLGEFPGIISVRNRTFGSGDGIFDTIDEAARAAEQGFLELSELSRDQRGCGGQVTV